MLRNYFFAYFEVRGLKQGHESDVITYLEKKMFD